MNKVVYIVLVLGCFFTACQPGEEEHETVVESGKLVSVSFSVGRQQPVLALDFVPDTRSAEPDGDFRVYYTDLETGPETRAVSQLTNTWLLQFAADGRCILCKNIGTVSEGQLDATLLTGENTTLYLLGNGPLTLVQPATLNDFEGNAYFSAEAYTDENAVPFIAKVADVGVTETGKLLTTDGDDVNFEMKRIAARLTLTCTMNLPEYRVVSVVLYNAPQKMYYVHASATAEVNGGPLTAHVVSGDTYTWFIGENLRGRGSSSTQQERYAEKAPASSTFIRITLQAAKGCETTTYDIYPGKDMAGNYDLVRNWDYVYTTTITKAGSDVVTDKRAQAEGIPVDLTAEPSNCYIVQPNKSYKFRIDVRGELNAVIPQGMSLTRTNAVNGVRLLWQDQPGLVKTLDYVDNSTAIVCFNAGVQGNALIMGMKGNSAEWSWHFWVIDETPASFVSNGTYAMDRNLGATSADPASVGFRGLIYQWGRKDPFAGAGGKLNENVRKTQYSNNGNVFVSNRYISPVALSLVVQHPDWFIYSSSVNGNYSNDWLNPANDDLWGDQSGQKTIFDPCPFGWRVPKDYAVWSNGLGGLLDLEWNPVNFCRQMGTNGWFPAAGRYNFEDPPSASKVGVLEIGADGYYWTSISATNNEAGVFHFSNAIVNPADQRDVPRTYGCSIRPVKVQ